MRLSQCNCKRLAEFSVSRKWMDANEKVDPTSYRKSVVVDARNGVKLEVLFYPLPGVDSYPLRQDSVVALVAAAKRLGLPDTRRAGPDGQMLSRATRSTMDARAPRQEERAPTCSQICFWWLSGAE